MANETTFDKLWEDLKGDSDEARELLEVSESIALIINDIVRARINKGLSQRDLADLCGMKQSAIARMERLQVIPRLDTIIKIARKLDLKVCLIGSTAAMVAEPRTTYTV
ncbi:MAG: helix-turn-helix transcriptional regulator [Firmicutes bacterium]|nr:helix-turn-helix transcriptional regulator [Bacillota bacterium]